MQLLLGVVLLLASTPALADSENEVPSKITVKENFNNPAILTRIAPYGPPPVMSNFVHQGTNFFFNPQILMGTNIPPIGGVISTIGSNEIEIPIVPEVKTPKLPEVVVPEIIIEEPVAVTSPPPLPPFIPVIPELPKTVVLEPIPPAPVLPPLELPQLPIQIEEIVEVIPPCTEDIIITEVKPAPPLVIPQAPSLPPLVFPPKITLPGIEIIETQPIEPAIVEVPVIPEQVMRTTVSKLRFKDESESIQVVSVPVPDISEIDFKINEIPSSIDLTNIEKLVSFDENKTLVMVPPSPELPVIEIQEPVVDVVISDKNKEHGLLIPGPTDCVHDIVVERIIPNMIKKTVTKSLEIVSYPTAQYPMIAPPLVPGYVIKG